MFAASTVHASFGFGTALIAMPLLSLVLGLATATPLVGLAALITVIAVLARDHRSIDFAAAGRLVSASVLGIPFGIALIRYAPESWVRGLLGGVLVIYALWSLARPRLPDLHWPGAVYLFGFVAGVLGGAYNTNAPPLVLYGALSRWAPAHFRATLSGYFLPIAIIICAAHGLAGLWTARVFELLGWSLPAVIAGNYLGARLARRVDVTHFTRLLYVLLVILGLTLLL